MAFAGCGDETTSACSPECFFGICDTEAEECVNPDTCQQRVDCIPGYTCSDAGVCEPITACETTEDCPSGICEKGVCQNGGGCLKPVDCVERTYCAEDNTCRPDRCYDTTCDEGVCQPSTGECVIQNTCSTEADCSSPERCIDGRCRTQEEFCSALTCERGVCGFEAEGCVDAENCQGMDAMCLEGSFCNEETNQCETDQCVENDIDCGSNGVCNPGSGECVNAESCTSNDDCLDDPVTWCLQGECGLASEACSPPCPGDQTCEYDPQGQTATCSEPGACDTSIDCTGDRECGGRSCLSATSCRADRFEPNDADSDVTNFGSVARRGTLEATLCSEDVDLYDLAPNDLPGPGDASQLQIAVEIPERDLGLGALNVTLIRPDGTTVQSETISADSESRRVAITTGVPVDLDTQDRFRVRVEPAESGPLKPGGLYYELSAERRSSSVESACSQAPRVSVGQRISGDLAQSSTEAFDLSCGVDEPGGGQDVYRLELDQPSEIRVAVPAAGGSGITTAIRKTCGTAGAELLCAEAGASGGGPTRVLGPGTYWLVVEAAGPSAGNYTVDVERVSQTTCGSSSNYCSDTETAQYCRPDGSGFDAITCERGCEPSTGECVPEMGDVCADAYQITSGQGRRADLRVVDDRYGIDPGGCLGDDPRTGGPDKAYRVVVPPGYAVTATAFFPEDVRGSLYVVDDCTSTTDSCLAGGQGSRMAPNEEVVSYANSTSSPTSYFVVVDTAANQPFSTVDIAFEIAGATCEPGEERCKTSSNTVEQCVSSGTDYTDDRSCGDFACSMASCVAPNTCATALDATTSAKRTNGAAYDRNVSGLTNDYTFTAQCGGSGFLSIQNDPDAVYKVSLDAGEFVEATLDSSNPRMLLTEGVSCPFQSRCLASNQDGFSRSRTLTYYAAEQKELYLLVDGTSTGSFPIDIEIGQSQCVLGNSSCVGGDVEYCNRTASGFNTFNCPPGGCSNGACNTKDSDFCYDAENLTADASTTGGASRTINLANLSNDFEADYGSPCSSVDTFDTDGSDAVYRLDVQSGESVTASLSSGGSSSDPTLTLVRDCLRPEISCVDSDASFSSTAQFTYVATQSETLYLIADHDGLSSNPSPFTLDVTVQ
jgi:hypothetical protein